MLNSTRLRILNTIRYHLDEQGVSIIPKLMKMIEKENVSIRNQCIEIAYDELQDYIEFDEIASIAEEQQLIHWKSYLSYIETGYYPKNDVSFEAAIGNWEKSKTEDARRRRYQDFQGIILTSIPSR